MQSKTENVGAAKYFVKCKAVSFEILVSSEFIENKDTDLVVESTSLRKLVVKNPFIKHLDVSGCTSLEELICNDNAITKLTLNETLRRLFCGQNKLRELKLSKKLTEVDCSNNVLEIMHLNKNLKVLYCENNLLTRLHLNRNIRYLVCSDNFLTELTLNRKLEILFCNNNCLTRIHVNEKLLTLFCPHNHLTEIKLNGALTMLYCNDNRLTDIELIDTIDTLACKNNKLTTIMLNKALTKHGQKVRDEIDPDVEVIPYVFTDFETYIPTSDGEICAICYEDNGEGMIITDCHHIFHRYCIVQIYNTRCPYCRKEIEQLK